MALHCTLARGPHSLLSGPPCELVLDAPDGTAGTVLHQELATRFGTGFLTVGGLELGSLVLGEPPLINGAVIVDDGGRFRKRPARQLPPNQVPSGLALTVHAGPGAGTVVPLERGSYTLGRSGARILIQDPELSRLHARIEVTDSEVSIADLGSANGTYVDGHRVRNAVISTNSTLRCGNTGFTLAFRDRARIALDSAGSSVRPPIMVRCQSDPGNRLVLLLTAALPLAIGVSLALATGMWMFLAFAAASAGSLLVPLLTGRRQRRKTAAALKAAVAQDRARRLGAGPSLAVLMLAAGRVDDWTESPDGGDLWLRLGEALQPANVQPEPAGAAIPAAGVVPVLLDPQPRTVFCGTRAVADGLIRALVMQVAGYPLGRATPVILHGDAARLPLPARYLPMVKLTGSADSCRAALAAEPVMPAKAAGPGILVLTGTSPAPEVENDLALAALDLGWRVLQFVAAEAPCSGSDVELAERESTLRVSDGALRFVPDLAPAAVFDTFCRRLAAGAWLPRSASTGIPATCGLEDLVPLDPAATAARWKMAREAQGLAVPVGMGTSGAQLLDLHSDGPHLLVAGTTGSGKSEFLRTFIVSLAVSYPPDRVNFLFIDFKGGSGLGPLAGLVHCTGLLTDLSSHGLNRTLLSLRAEVRYREEVLGAAGVPDLTVLRSSPAEAGTTLPHLVIVIDEFRMLVDDHPEVLRELMRIASVGRSLGIHLVMATQRPQGALTADIRANVTSSIALRVQSEMESIDILNHRAAAGISIGCPGRAFLARGTEPPREFQAASLQSGRTTAPQRARVRLAVEYFAEPADPAAAVAGVAAQTPTQAAEPLLGMVRDLWNAAGGASPRRPVADPLPPRLQDPDDCLSEPHYGMRAGLASPDQLPATSDSAGHDGDGSVLRIALGVVDLPARQCIEVLWWDPARDGHLALVGGPASGAAEAMESVSRRLLCHDAESHAYVLDAAGGLLQPLAGSPRTGAYVGLHELRRAVRVLERLADELALRLSQREAHRTPLLVVIAGWGSWASAFRAGPHSWVEDLVHDLVRDGRAAGIIVLLAGDRELVSARFTAAVPNRLYFPAGATEESRLAWPRLPETEAVKGRAVAVGPVAGAEPSACQLFERNASGGVSPPLEQVGWQAAVRAPSHRPFRVEPLPALVTVDALLAQAADSHGGRLAETPLTLLGLAGDEPAPTGFRIPPAGVIAVLGGPASGKTNALHAIEELNAGAAGWLQPKAGEDPCGFWNRCLAAARTGELSGQRVLLVDDADRLPPRTVRDVADLHGLGHAVVFAALPGPLLSQRVPLAAEARSSGAGLLLCPRSLSDGDLFGVRFEVEPHAPPGRGVLIESGRASALQVARARSCRTPQQSPGKNYSAGGAPPVREA